MKKKILTTILSTGITFSVTTNSPEYAKLNLFPKNQQNNIKKIKPINSKSLEIQTKNLSTPKYLNKKQIRFFIDSFYKKTKTILSKKELESIAFKESSFNAHAKSNAGAKGLYQIRKGAWMDSGINLEYSTNVFDPEKNTLAAMKYYSWLERAISKKDTTWKNSTRIEKRNKLLAAYNWGFGNLKKNNWKIPTNVKETRKYIEFVHKYSQN